MARTPLLARVASWLSSVRSTWQASVPSLWSGWGAYYASTDPRRTVIDRSKFRPGLRTADQALVPSLQQLVADCAALECRSPLMRAAVEGMRAELVGSGIAIQPDTNDADLDEVLAESFNLWAESALIDGKSLWEWQWTGAGELVTQGCVLARWLVLPPQAGDDLPRDRLLPLDFGWFSPTPVGAVPDGHGFVHGKVLDRLGRAVAYHLRDPENPDRTEVVPARDIVHVYLPRRSRSAHGEPIAAPLIERALNDDEIVNNELAAGRQAAEVSGFIEAPLDNEDPATLQARLTAIDGAIATAEKAQSYSVNGRSVTNANLATLYQQREVLLYKLRGATTDSTTLPVGQIKALPPGYKANIVENKRPSAAVAEFRTTIRQDAAAVTGLPLYWFDADASKANYTSLREAGQKTKRRLAPLHQIVGRMMASQIYLRLLPSLLLRANRGLPTQARERRLLFRHWLRPDVPGYIDPAKDAEAALKAVAGNLMTYEEACAERGRNFQAIIRRRKAENKQLAEAGLPIPTPAPINVPMAPAPASEPAP